MNGEPTWWIYLLGCEDGRTYGGVTNDVKARYKAHVEGKGAKFTRSNPPICILGVKEFATRSEALKAEIELKKLDRDARLQWAKLNPPPAPTRILS